MIDFAGDMRRILFSGDIDEEVIVQNVGSDDISVRGIYGYQVENPQIESVDISGAKQLRLALSTLEIEEKAVAISQRATTLVLPSRNNKAVMALEDPQDNTKGLTIFLIGECE